MTEINNPKNNSRT